MSRLNADASIIEFDTPANRVIAQQQPKNQFGINTSLPDLPFLRQLAIQGRMRYLQGERSDDGIITSLTPANGETFFFLRGNFSAATGSGARVDIVNDGNVRLTARTVLNVTKDLDIGIDSLVGDGIKVFSLTNTGNTQLTASLVGWVENTSRIRDVTT